VYRSKCKGSASTSEFSAQGIEAAVRKAVSIASFTTADEYAGLADAELMATNMPDLDLYHPWDVDVDAATALALRAESAAREADSRIDNSEGAVVGTGAMDLPAVVAIAAVTGLLVLGVSESALVNNIVVAIKVSVVVAFIAIGALFVNPDHDYPQEIRYRRDGNRLIATISLLGGEDARSFDKQACD